MNRLTFALLSFLLMSVALSTGSDESESPLASSSHAAIKWFPELDPAILSASPNIDFIANLTAYQQTTDYNCGPAALLSLASFYGLPGIEKNLETEMRIAKELGTRDFNSSQPGSKPEEMAMWLEKNGFDVVLEFEDRGDATALQRLRDNIKNGTPTLVEWIDLSGHWAIAVGYDYRNLSDPWDDILILADPYDKYDDYCDGYSFVNANRFYFMWFDALYFDDITWRTMIIARPKDARDFKRKWTISPILALP